jgi:hypothetical protein
VSPFQGEPDANRHQFTRIEFGLTVFGYVFHRIIDKAENLDDREVVILSFTLVTASSRRNGNRKNS